MNFLGIGGLELVVVMLVALFVVGPVRLVEGARTARKYMTEIRRQREELTQMIEEVADVEGVKEALDQEGIIGEVKDIADELNAFKDEASTISDDFNELQDVARSVRRPGGYTRRSGRATRAEDQGADEGSLKDESP